MEKPKKPKKPIFSKLWNVGRLHRFENIGFLGFFGFSIGFTTILLVFIGFPMEKPTFVQKTNLSVRGRGGAAEALSLCTGARGPRLNVITLYRCPGPKVERYQSVPVPGA